MKRINKRIGIIMTAMLIAIVTPMVGHSQPDPGGSPDVPVDGGITLLLAVAGVAGVKKVRDNKKRNAEEL